MLIVRASDYPSGPFKSESLLAEKGPTYSVAMVRSGCEFAEVRRVWDSLTACAASDSTPEASPAYFDHLLSSGEAGSAALASVRDDAGSIVGIVPLVLERVPLCFDVSWYVLGEIA
jgi:hypothetical protein